MIGLGTAVMVTVCLVAARLRPAALEVLAAAIALAMFALVSHLADALSDLPWSAATWPVRDLVCGGLALAMYRRDRALWKKLLAGLFALQCGAHVWFWGAVVAEGLAGPATSAAYLGIVNSALVLEIIIITVAGGAYVVSYARDRGGLFLGDFARDAGRR